MDGKIQNSGYGSQEAALKGAVPSFLVIADASPDAIISIDWQGKMIQVNPSASGIFGYPESELIGKNVTMLMPERYRLAHKRGLKRFVDTGHGRYTGKTIELNALKKDSSEFPIELSLVTWDTGDHKYFTGTIRDVSARTQAQANLKMSYRIQNVLNDLLRLSLTDMPFVEQLQQGVDIILGAPFMPLEPKGGIFIVEGDRPELVLKATRNLPPTLLGLCGKVPFGECLCGRAAAAGELVFASGIDQRHEHRYEGIVPHGHYVVPIISQAREGHVLGVLVLYVHAGHVRDEHEEKFLVAAADTLAGIIERRQAEVAVQDSEMRYRTLFERSPDAIVIIDPETAAHIQFNDVAHQQLGYSREEFAKLRISDYEISETPEETRTHIENILQREEEAFETQHVTKDGHIREVLVRVTTIMLGARTAILAIFHDITERKQAKAFSDALNRINKDIGSTLDFDEIMQRVVEESSKAIGCDQGAIYIREEEDWAVRYVHGFPLDLIGARFSDEEAPFACRAASTGRPVVSHQPEYNEHQRCELMARYGAGSLLAVPLFTKEETVGSLMFTRASAAAPFSAVEIEFAEKLGASVSLAIENSRLYAREHRIADRLQGALLTVSEHVRGVEFGNLYRSTTVEVAKTGGDFYDIFELGDDRIGILMGDVSGKGLAAATLTALVKNTVKAYAFQDNLPASVVELTNSMIERSSGSETFITLFFGILDKNVSILTYCNAGHPPPILIRERSETSSLPANNPVIGVFPDLEYTDSQVTLGAGDTLVLYTDGVIEARCEKELYGEQRLFGLLNAMETTHVKLIPQMILDSIQEYSNCRLFDDIAILAVSVVSEED